jgi:predicted nucleic acid-binding protein
MRVYADTSWWLAYKSVRDAHHGEAVSLFDRLPDAEILWTPWQRVEVLNTFRQAERSAVVSPGEARRLIRGLEQEVRLGYWQHVEFDWTDAVRTACELGAEHSLKMIVRSMDLFHVAIALEVAADGFLTFDQDQRSLAAAAGLPPVELNTKSRK